MIPPSSSPTIFYLVLKYKKILPLISLITALFESLQWPPLPVDKVPTLTLPLRFIFHWWSKPTLLTVIGSNQTRLLPCCQIHAKLSCLPALSHAAPDACNTFSSNTYEVFPDLPIYNLDFLSFCGTYHALLFVFICIFVSPPEVDHGLHASSISVLHSLCRADRSDISTEHITSPPKNSCSFSKIKGKMDSGIH